MELNREDDDVNDVLESTSQPVLTTISVHHFGDEDDAFSITVIENMKEEYGLFVWPRSVALAEYVWQQRSRFSGAKVVELGAGTSLPGLVAAKVGADVTLTDDLNRPEVLDNMRRVCDLNNLKCKVLGLTWVGSVGCTLYSPCAPIPSLERMCFTKQLCDFPTPEVSLVRFYDSLPQQKWASSH